MICGIGGTNGKQPGLPDNLQGAPGKHLMACDQVYFRSDGWGMGVAGSRSQFSGLVGVDCVHSISVPLSRAVQRFDSWCPLSPFGEATKGWWTLATSANGK